MDVLEGLEGDGRVHVLELVEHLVEGLDDRSLEIRVRARQRLRRLFVGGCEQVVHTRVRAQERVCPVDIVHGRLVGDFLFGIAGLFADDAQDTAHRVANGQLFLGGGSELYTSDSNTHPGALPGRASARSSE